MLIKILTICFYFLFCLTPFVFNRLNSELFEYNKMIVVYALTILISGTWLLRIISEKRLIFKKTPLDLPLVLFLVSQVLSTVFSIDPHTSIWGYYSRSNGGLLSTVSYLILYYAFVSNFSKDEVVKFLKFSVFAGTIAAFYAIPEHFGVSPSCVILTGEFSASCWVQDVQARVFGTLGQPNWLAAYLGMLIFPAIYFFITSASSKHRFLYLLSTISMYLAFTFTYSRGATLGLIGGFSVFALSQLFISGGLSKISNLKLTAIVAGGFLVINILFGSAITEFRLLKNPSVPVRPGLSQSAAPGTQLENGGTESGQIRLIVWQGAVDIFKAYPIFGSGVETFAYAYYQFRPNEHNLVSEWDFLYNKAHNEYLNYLATTGGFGFFSYLLIILVFLLWVIRHVLFSKDKESYNNSLLITSLTAGYTSYLIQNFFLFSVVIIAVLFYLFPAFAFVYANANKDISEKSKIFKTVNSLLLLISKKNVSLRSVQILAVIIILVLLNSLYSIWQADTLYKKGADLNDLGNPGRAYNYLIESVKLNSKEPLYISELGNSAASSALALLEEDATTSGELKDDSVFFTDLSLSISPMNTTILRTAIRTYFQLSLIDPSYQPKTLEVINRSIELAPSDPKLLLNKAVILTQFEKEADAITSLQKAIELKPNYREARINLAQLLVKSDRKEAARIQIDALLKLFPGDEEVLKIQESIK